jgi:hypothetical protein
MFGPNSRYYLTKTDRLVREDGTEVVYLRRRFVPAADRFAVIGEHLVTEGERLDLIAHQHLGDPEQFWRIADANDAVRPEELTDEPGRRLRITLPEGIPGASNA